MSLKKVASLSLFGIVLLFGSSAWGFTNPLSGFLSDIQAQFEQFTTVLKSQNQELAQKLEPVLKDLEQGLEEATGAMKIIDPIVARQQVEDGDRSDGVEGIFEQNSVNRDRIIANVLDREINRSMVAAILGKSGQEQTKKILNATQSSVETVANEAELAQQEESTQEVIKRLASQNQQQAAILGSLNSNVQEQKQATQMGNLQLANISEAVDEANLAQRNEITTEADNVRQISAQSGLF